MKFASSTALAHWLGDPLDGRSEFSFAARLRDDESTRFPDAALASLNDWGMQRFYVPSTLGGELCELAQLGELLRLVAGRDLTLAIGHGVGFLGSMPVWLAGNAAQQAALAPLILAGERSSLALTEADVGSDLLNMNTRASAMSSGWQLQGSKWLVNGLQRNRMVTVYARTQEQGGARGFSLFMVDKKQHPTAFSNYQRLPTLGVRAADLSAADISVELPSDALLGTAGSGFEWVLKGLQLTRLLCGSLALGALDTGLASCLRFALNRPIYNKRVADLPQTQRLLAESYAEHLWMDAITQLAQRAVQFVPGQAVIHAALIKYLVPVLGEQAMARLAVVLGARYYLRDQHDSGIFQKMLRDNLLISLFDGSTQVNLHVLSHQLRQLARNPKAQVPSWIDSRIPAPPLNWQGLALASREEVFSAALPVLLDELSSWAALQTHEVYTTLVQQLWAALDDWHQSVEALDVAQLQAGEPLCFDLARQYCLLTGVAMLLCQWRYNPAHNPVLAVPEVLALILAQACAALGRPERLPASVYAEVFQQLCKSQNLK